MEAKHAILAALAIASTSWAALATVPGQGAAQTTSGEVHHVHIEGFDMQPSDLTIERGDTVEWHNHDGSSHTATDDGGEWDTGVIPSGGTASITFDEARDDTYHCEIHPGSMSGFRLTVVNPNQAPSVAIETPTDGASLSGTVEVTGTAADADGSVEQVEVRIDDGPWQTAKGTTAWSFAWNTAQVVDGIHTVSARSYDGEDHSPIQSVTVATDNPTPDLSVETIDTEQEPGRVDIEVTIANLGDAASPPTSLAVDYRSPNAQGSVGEPTLDSLDPGEATTLTLAWDTTNKIGSFTLIARADPGDLAVDPVPANDEDETTVCIPSAQGATCAVPGTVVGAVEDDGVFSSSREGVTLRSGTGST